MNDILKVIILALIEGITEFLPISSTGHLIIANEFINLKPESFANAFNVIIQLGAILSVVVIYFEKLNFLSSQKTPQQRKNTLDIWKKVIIGFFPAAVFGFLFDDIIEKYLFNPQVVAFMLLFYGVVIVVLENRRKKNSIKNISQMSYATALKIGLFQCAAMIPGTSRSAATIIGAVLLGANRKTAAEFSFFLAIPTMVGATGYKMLKLFLSNSDISAYQIFLILLGSIISFIVALIVIRKFMSYIQKHNFVLFGLYRIVLAIVIFIYFRVKGV